MINVPVYNIQGQEVETIQVDEEKLGGEVRHALLKQALVYYHANQRQGTVRTLARGEVEGSTRKIYKQKGTGNARQGSVRQPVRVGGGHAKQKRPKDWRLDLPIKARRLARNSAILAKLQSGSVKVVSELKLQSPKTKEMALILKALKIDRSVVVAFADHNEDLYRATRNIKKTTVTTAGQLNAWDILRNQTLLMTREGFTQLIG